MKTSDMQTIDLQKGLGKIRFGINKNELIELIGKPDEKEQEDEVESWHYDELELSVSFEKYDSDWELLTLSVTDSAYTLAEHALIGLARAKVMDLLTVLNLGEMEYEDLSENDDDKQIAIYIEAQGLSLFFDNNILQEIQWDMQ